MLAVTEDAILINVIAEFEKDKKNDITNLKTVFRSFLIYLI